MDFYMKLPRSKKEFALFMVIISIISVNIIAPLITGFEVGFSLTSWVETLKVMPFLWPCIIALVLLTHKPAQYLTEKIVAKGDSFNSCIVINIMCTVFLMSVFLTVIGTWIGSRHMSLEPIIFFFYRWPRNFAISFAVEALIAQPIARAILYKMHKHQDSRSSEPKANGSELNAEA
ncbi:hypothetical protein AGMMS50284_1740 [Clostridia bacterium]|nr:hypothetical protein AGMMS50284_1740 [Clostridia bacterium]